MSSLGCSTVVWAYRGRSSVLQTCTDSFQLAGVDTQLIIRAGLPHLVTTHHHQQSVTPATNTVRPLAAETSERHAWGPIYGLSQLPDCNVHNLHLYQGVVPLGCATHARAARCRAFWTVSYRMITQS